MEKAIEKVSETETESSDVEITVIDLFAALWKHKFLIIGITFAFVLFSLVYSVISLKLPPEESYLPNVFTVNADIIVSKKVYQSVYLLTSRDFFDAVIEEFNLYEKFALDPEEEKSSISAARGIVSGMIDVSYNKNNSIFTISCTNVDSQLAFDIVNYAINYLEQKLLSIDENFIKKEILEESIDSCYEEIQRLQQLVKEEQEHGDEQQMTAMEIYFPNANGFISAVYTSPNLSELSVQQSLYNQLKSQYQNVDVATQMPVYQIVSPPEIPYKKSGPSRSKICIILTLVGFCISILLSFLLEALKNLKGEDVAAKFKRFKRDN